MNLRRLDGPAASLAHNARRPKVGSQGKERDLGPHVAIQVIKANNLGQEDGDIT